MAFFDLSLEQLKEYRPARTEPADFDSFWDSTLTEARRYPLNLRLEPYDSGMKTLDFFDVTYSGYAGQPIKGWFVLPKYRQGKLPCVVEYIGYGGGRGLPINWLNWASAGFAHFIMDTRGQGSAWMPGDTPDLEPEGSSPQYPGFMTRGVLSPQTYYYRRVFTDGVRAVEAARSIAEVDPGRIALTGGSQGGGITLAVAGLVPDVAIAMPDVPFLCHYKRATTLVNSFPYGEIAAFCKTHRDKIQTVFDTLAYFDNVNFAPRARAKALFSTALMDDICPPSTVFAAYNYYAGPKDITVYEYNQHDGGGIYHSVAKTRFLDAIWPDR